MIIIMIKITIIIMIIMERVIVVIVLPSLELSTDSAA